MDNAAILKKIIQENGSCTWSKQSICAKCPIARLKQKEDGSYFSCIEAVRAQDLSEEEADFRYKEVAERLLLDETVDAILGEE